MTRASFSRHPAISMIIAGFSLVMMALPGCGPRAAHGTVVVFPTPFEFGPDVPLADAPNISLEGFQSITVQARTSKLYRLIFRLPSEWTLVGPDEAGRLFIRPQAPDDSVGVIVEEQGLLPDVTGNPTSLAAYISGARIAELSFRYGRVRVVEVERYPAGDVEAFLVRMEYQQDGVTTEVLEAHFGAGTIFFATAKVKPGVSARDEDLIIAVLLSMEIRRS